ncbi:hypothetical protein CCP2SC5_220037 [Azospirillaceae bacterium]
MENVISRSGDEIERRRTKNEQWTELFQVASWRQNGAASDKDAKNAKRRKEAKPRFSTEELMTLCAVSPLRLIPAEEDQKQPVAEQPPFVEEFKEPLSVAIPTIEKTVISETIYDMWRDQERHRNNRTHFQIEIAAPQASDISIVEESHEDRAEKAESIVKIIYDLFSSPLGTPIKMDVINEIRKLLIEQKSGFKHFEEQISVLHQEINLLYRIRSETEAKRQASDELRETVEEHRRKQQELKELDEDIIRSREERDALRQEIDTLKSDVAILEQRRSDTLTKTRDEIESLNLLNKSVSETQNAVELLHRRKEMLETPFLHKEEEPPLLPTPRKVETAPAVKKTPTTAKSNSSASKRRIAAEIGTFEMICNVGAGIVSGLKSVFGESEPPQKKKAPPRSQPKRLAPSGKVA